MPVLSLSVAVHRIYLLLLLCLPLLNLLALLWDAVHLLCIEQKFVLENLNKKIVRTVLLEFLEFVWKMSSPGVVQIKFSMIDIMKSLSSPLLVRIDLNFLILKIKFF